MNSTLFLSLIGLNIFLASAGYTQQADSIPTEHLILVPMVPQKTPKQDANFKMPKGRLYALWGYNKTFFSKSNSTFHTPDGTFTIHKAAGVDRPTPFDAGVYFNPVTMTIPQYNLTLGYLFNPTGNDKHPFRFGIEAGMDHMKWVFDRERRYEISGNYEPTIITSDFQEISLEEAKASGNTTWLSFEHTNGYNYVFLGFVFDQQLFRTRKGEFGMDAQIGVGSGLFIPQTSVHIHRDQVGNWAGNDNEFHIAGSGSHASVGLKMVLFDRVFLLATTRASVIRVDHAKVDVDGSYLIQDPIAAVEFIGQIGYQANLFQKKNKKRKAK